MSNRIGISMRTAAALAAAVVLLPLLVFVNPSPSSAHEQTEERCDYDPLTQQEYNCRQVEVSHVHPPNHYSPPPDTSPRPTTTTAPTTTEPPSCPAGQHSNGGAGRNCHAHSFTPPCGTGTWSPGHGHTPIQRPACPVPEPPSCPAGQHSNGGAGRDCHANHDYSNIGCGTGTWAPHPGHSPVSRPPCTTTTTPDEDPDNEDDDDDEGGESESDDEGDSDDGGCLSGTFVSGNCQPRGGDDGDAGDDATQYQCGDWAQDLIDSLSRPNSDGIYSLPTQPAGCGGPSTSEMLGRVRVFGADAARAFSNAFEAAMERQARHSEAEGELFSHTGDAINELFDVIRAAWGEVPNPAKAAALGVACLFLIPAEEAGSLTPAGPALTAAQVATCAAALQAISDVVSGSDGGSDGDASPQSNSDDETTEQTVKPVQTPDMTTQTEATDGDNDDQQSDGDSSDASSETDLSTTTTTTPVAVGAVTGLGGAADGNSVWLGWNAPATGPTPTAYRVLRTASGGAEREVARVGGNAYFDSKVQSGVTYTYRIQAISGTLAGPISAPANVTIP